MEKLDFQKLKESLTTEQVITLIESLGGFVSEILDVANEDNWKEKEKYWISYYNTFNGVGYNTTPGGDGEGYGGILSDEEVEGICCLLENNKIPQSMIAIEYGVSETLVSNINCGLRYKNPKRTYPIRKNYKNGLGDYETLVQLLKTTVLSFREIAERLNIAAEFLDDRSNRSTVTK